MIKRITLIFVPIWLLSIGLFAWHNIYVTNEYERRVAYSTAQAFFEQIVVTRQWNAQHGGVYVPITDSTQPNPYLEDPLKVLSVDQGLVLTKINPAFMTRQISELAEKRPGGVQFHITSLSPIRPENAPADWEREWLRSFVAGAKEQGAFFENNNQTGFRYMAPLLVGESCLGCHAKQGYKLGDIRGGISVTLPFVEYHDHLDLIIGYVFSALVGTALILLGGAQLARERQRLIHANKSLEDVVDVSQKTIKELEEAREEIRSLSGILPICMHCKGIRDDQGYWKEIESFIAERSDAEFSHGICEKCLKEHY